MKSKYLLIIFLSPFILFSQTNPPTIQWQNCLGGTMRDLAQSVIETFDGGYIVSGYTESNDSDVIGSHGNSDCWIVKLNNIGGVQWKTCYGGAGVDYAFSIQQTSDSGYIVAGTTTSNNGDITGNHGGNGDVLVLKLNNAGIIQWQKCLGGSSQDWANSIVQTYDGGYIVAGLSSSNDGDVTGNHGGPDFWIVKISSVGTIQWQKSLGGSGGEQATSIQQTTDSGYIVAGLTDSNNGDVSGNHGGFDYWIVRLSITGIIQWQKCFGGLGNEIAHSVQQTNDYGFIIAGSSFSNDSDVTGNHGNNDYWIVKLDSTSAIQWQKSLGGTNDESAYSIQQTTNSGYIVVGQSNSFDGDVTGNHGGYDFWLVNLNSSGSIQWQKCYGGSNDDMAHSIQQTSDGGFILTGYSSSNDSDVTGNHGGIYDYWVVKLDFINGIEKLQTSIANYEIVPNPFSNETILSFQGSSFKKVDIEIRDIEGGLIKTLVTKNINYGVNKIVWDATNNSNVKVDDGIYFITVFSDKERETKKVVFMRN